MADCCQKVRGNKTNQRPKQQQKQINNCGCFNFVPPQWIKNIKLVHTAAFPNAGVILAMTV